MIGDLLIEHRNTMAVYARRLTRSASAADDVLQSACVLALTSEATDIEHPKAWLRRCVLNAYRHTYQRQIRSRLDFRADTDDLATAVPVDGAQEHSLVLSEVTAAVKQMPESQQTAFALVLVNGWSASEAADIAGVTKQRMARDVVKTRAAIELSQNRPAWAHRHTEIGRAA